jgi:hypothetical protein
MTDRLTTLATTTAATADRAYFDSEKTLVTGLTSTDGKQRHTRVR